jgi:magnesium-transporting ATPase (P-type)
MNNTAWHSLSTEQVREKLSANDGGLTDADAAIRLHTYGANHLPQTTGRSAIGRLLMQCHNVLIYVLLVSAGIAAALAQWLDMAVIIAVVVANAVIGFVQEGKAEKAMSTLHQMLSPLARVLRNGQPITLPAEQLVPSDVVLLEAGDKIPTDLRLISSHVLICTKI